MEVYIGIRELNEFVLKSGSLESSFGGINRRLEGTLVHKRLQKEAGRNYHPEQTLRTDIEHNGITYHLSGRCDGVIYEDGEVVIDEIKTVSVPLLFIDEDTYPAHWGQAVFYAWIIAGQQDLDSVTIQLTYYNVDTDQVKFIRKEYSYGQLAERVGQILSLYERWALMAQRHSEDRNACLKEMKFPFEDYRNGQKELSAAVYRTIRDSDRLFACAPTGIGKTMAALFPTLKSFDNLGTEKVFYLTAKTMTSLQAASSVRRLYERDPELKLKTIVITAKDKACFLDERNCSPRACLYSDGYFDRINDVVYEALQKYSFFDPELIYRIARENSVCPYELSLDLSVWCDVIICDYNYLFDPQARLQRFFPDEKQAYVFLVDEAHNLPDRVRDMYSRDLSLRGFRAVRKKFTGRDRKLVRALNRAAKSFSELLETLEEEGVEEKVYAGGYSLAEPRLRLFMKECSDFFERHRSEETDPDLLQLYFDTSFFLYVYNLFDERYAAVATRNGSNVTLRLFCIDPSGHIDSALEKGEASILFSATLTPVDYYINQTGGKGRYVSIPSPFPQDNLCLLTARYIDTSYTRRQSSVQLICSAVRKLYKARKGNYIIYFPSYRYMNMCADEYRCLYPEDELTVQESDMDEPSKQQFLSAFEVKDDILAFCILGGIFGEGIDLTGDRLTGAGIVSVGLPQVNTYSNLLRDYYDSVGLDGFKYAYQYPGMNKVMQAVGRIIRTETDRGAALLMDRRFSSGNYMKNMPVHWNHLISIGDPGDLDDILADFWKKS